MNRGRANCQGNWREALDIGGWPGKSDMTDPRKEEKNQERSEVDCLCTENLLYLAMLRSAVTLEA